LIEVPGKVPGFAAALRDTARATTDILAFA
jgi:hypothetical protein